MLAEFHFLRPYWLLAVIPIFLILRLFLIQQSNNSNWQKVCDIELLPHILMGSPEKSNRYRVLLIGLCSLLIMTALAGPTWQRIPLPVFRSGSDLIIALNLSQSMDAVDIKPSRLSVARKKIAALLALRDDGQAALIVYAGDAFTVTPLTHDKKIITSQLFALNTSVIPKQGSEIANTLAHATSLLKQEDNAPPRGQHILLLTDNLSGNVNEASIKKIRQQGYLVSILAVGTEKGSSIILPDGEVLRDKNGSVVISVTNHTVLEQMANIGGGQYMAVSSDDKDINALHKFFNSHLFNENKRKIELTTDRWLDQGPWLILLILPLAALAFRKGVIFLLFLYVLPIPRHVSASEFDNAWLNNDQFAMEQFNAGNVENAAIQFQDPAWKASAMYLIGNYPAAIDLLESIKSEDSLYNSGNALARLGRYEAAIAAYDLALSLNPKNDDARYNREIVKKTLDQLQSGQQQQGQQSKPNENNADDESDESVQYQPGNRNNQEQQSPDENSERETQQNGSGSAGPEIASSNTESDQKNAQQDSDEDDTESAMSKLQQLQNEGMKSAEQWLRQIPDDPTTVLKRKFLYQYQEREKRKNEKS